jgi:hypothetical protein
MQVEELVLSIVGTSMELIITMVPHNDMVDFGENPCDESDEGA